MEHELLMSTKRRLAGLFGGLVLLASSGAWAQQRDPQARGMVRQALEDYQNLDIDGALNRLRLAMRACGASGCSPGMMARIHMALGVIAVGGQNNNTTGVNEFTEGLRLD